MKNMIESKRGIQIINLTRINILMKMGIAKFKTKIKIQLIHKILNSNCNFNTRIIITENLVI